MELTDKMLKRAQGIGSPTPEALNAFEAHRARVEKERELREHRWSLKELDDLDKVAAEDSAIAAERARLQPYIDESNRRGDFRYPFQMSIEEYKAHIGTTKVVYRAADLQELLAWSGAISGSHGKDGPVASMPIATFMREEAKNAFAEGRVIMGGDRRLFGGETPAQRDARLAAVQIGATEYIAAVTTLRGELDEFKKTQTADFRPETRRRFAGEALTRLAAEVRIRGWDKLLFDPRESPEFRELDTGLTALLLPEQVTR